VLRRRPSVVFQVTRSGDEVLLTFSGKQIAVPSYVAADIEFMAGPGVFRAADLPGSLDDAGRLVLVRKLLLEGFLTLAIPETA
jgi:hypothetical protein